MRTVLPFAVFLLFLGLWTWKLLEPDPVPVRVGEGISAGKKFLLSKALHLGGYAFLTVLAAALPVRRPYFRATVAVLALHGGLTEYLQHAMAVGRTGKVSDVVIDWAGVGFGLLLLRAWRRGGPAPSFPTSANPLSAGRAVK
jgi:hypothetical protein